MDIPVINSVDLQVAIEKMARTSESRVNESLALSLAFRVKEFMEDEKYHHPFPEALRYALNALHIRFEDRKRYSSVMGSYFGTHGSRAAARNKATHKPTKKAQVNDRSPEVFVEQNGQLAFRV